MTFLDDNGRIKPLVERLRQAAQDGREIITEWDHDPHLYDEAATEIDRLRGLLNAKMTPGYELLAGTIEQQEAEIAKLRAAMKDAWTAIMAGDSMDAAGTLSRALKDQAGD